MKRRIVVTGLGLVTPLGNGVSETWQSLVRGGSGIGKITRFDPTPLSVHFAAEVKNFASYEETPSKDARHMGLFIRYGIAAGSEAVRDSGLENYTGDLTRVGVMIGSGIGGLPEIEATANEVQARGPRRISPFFVPIAIINMISGNLSIKYGFQGPNLAVVTACTTGLHNIGQAFRTIQYGDADIVVAGGAESSISLLGVGGFAAARALSTRNDDPATASRPWDRDRDGFVLGEGAGVLVLEEYEHARRRGAKIYAELTGFGMSADAHHITAPLEDGSGAVRCMEIAMKDAGLNHGDIQYVNAHGTSTPLGDIAETVAIKRTFGDHAKKLVINSTKSMTGHLLGGAGGVESVFTVLAIHHQISPPTINIFNQDPACDLDYCANQARSMKIRHAIKNSFGFGGTNGSLIFSRV